MNEIPGQTADPALQLGIAAELARAFAAEGRELLTPLAMLLQTTLPDSVEVHLAGGLFSKKAISGITVELGEWRYILEDAGGDPKSGPLNAKRTRSVRGIALKTEDIPAAQWLAEVGAALQARAASNQATRDALAGWVW